MKDKVGIVSLGCPKNLVDSEIMLGLLVKEGYEITNDSSEAGILIVNTCGFIEDAKQESINTILEMAQYKKDKCRILIAAGCLSERYREEINSEIPEVDGVLGTGNYKDIAEVIKRVQKGEKPVLCGSMGDISYLENERIISTAPSYAYLKIAEGCDNCCTYCIIPKIRGKYRSRKMDDILIEAESIAEKGIKELILVAQDTTRYGTDIYGQRKLAELIRKLSRINGIEWIRILYCYPDEIDDGLIDEFSNNEKLCKYIDIPIQHASSRILHTMGRRSGSIPIQNLINRLREKVPGIVIRTSLIVGFPGETNEEFKILHEFVRNIKFDRLGVFEYSREENTPAYLIKPQVNGKVKKERYDKIMMLQKKITEDKSRSRVGKIYKTIVEGVSEDGIFYHGRTYAESPDIDGKVYFTNSNPKPLKAGDFVNVKILDIDNYDLIGEVEYESTK